MSKLHQAKHHLKNSFLPTLSVVVLFLSLVTLYHIFFARKIIPGVYIANVSVGGKNFPQAVDALKAKQNSLEQETTIKINESEFSITPEMLDQEYDWTASVSRAFEVGRTGNLYIDTKDKIAGLFGKDLKIKPFYNIDLDAFSAEVLKIKGVVNVQPVDAKYILENNKLTIVPAVTGAVVDEEDLKNKIISDIETLGYRTHPLTLEEKLPKISTQILEDKKAEAEKIVFNNLLVKSDNDEWNFTPEELLNFLDVSFEEDDGDINLTVNDEAFDQFYLSISDQVNILPRGEVTELQDNKVTGFKIIREGKRIDQKEFKSAFKRAYSKAEKEVQIPMQTISESSAQDYGILELLGEGSSKYSGSGAARVNNLTLAAQRTSGVLVPPDTVYSFNESVGEISGKNGYDTAYVISGGKTVLGEGGGVCQTSTTLFRAVLNSGLPVTTRYAHAYRVTYYEQDQPVGLDAAIYQPSLDFKFKNDTENYVLIQSYPDPQNYALRFRIFGTPDGRTVQMSEPVITNVRGAPAPQYIDDPSLPKGTVKQIDFAAPGATSVYTRTVMKDGEVLHEEEYKSNYTPWKAVFLKGTKD